MRPLLASVLAFAFVSSGTALLWRVEQVRILAFLAALAALASVALGRDPHLRPSRPATTALLALLLASILVVDSLRGSVDPLDYKVAVLLPLLLLAPNLARGFGGHDVAELVWRLLTGYVLATALLAIQAVPESLVRGREDLARFDFTGSLIGHTGLCIVYAIATLARLGSGSGASRALVHAGLLGAATSMILLTGTRTVLVTIAIYLLLDVAAAGASRAAVMRVALAAGLVLSVLTVHTLLVSDDFLERLLAGSSEDWSSGRAASQLHWLVAGLQEPFGLGFGAVREQLYGGRPALDGTRLLEWPHNEPLRFFVEAGPPGLAFVVVLLGSLTRMAVDAARAERRPLPRALMLAIAADMLAQSLFQNYFNSIYHATALVLILAILAAQALDRPSLGRPPSCRDLPEAAAPA